MRAPASVAPAAPGRGDGGGRGSWSRRVRGRRRTLGSIAAVLTVARFLRGALLAARLRRTSLWLPFAALPILSWTVLSRTVLSRTILTGRTITAITAVASIRPVGPIAASATIRTRLSVRRR